MISFVHFYFPTFLPNTFTYVEHASLDSVLFSFPCHWFKVDRSAHDMLGPIFFFYCCALSIRLFAANGNNEAGELIMRRRCRDQPHNWIFFVEKQSQLLIDNHIRYLNEIRESRVNQLIEQITQTRARQAQHRHSSSCNICVVYSVQIESTVVGIRQKPNQHLSFDVFCLCAGICFHIHNNCEYCTRRLYCAPAALAALWV